MSNMNKYNIFINSMTEFAKRTIKKFLIIMRNYNRLTINNKFFVNLNNMIIKLNIIIRNKSNTIDLKNIEIAELKKIIISNINMIYLKDIEITELKEIIISNINIIDSNDIEIAKLKEINISNINIIDLKDIEINKVVNLDVFNKSTIGLKNIKIDNLNIKILELNKTNIENTKAIVSKCNILSKGYVEIISTINVDIVDARNILFEYIIYLETFNNRDNFITNIVKIIVYKNLNYVCYEGVQKTMNTGYSETIFNDYPKYYYVKQDSSVKITNQIYIEKLKKLVGYIFDMNINGTKDFEAFIELIVYLLKEKTNMKLGFIENINILCSLMV